MDVVIFGKGLASPRQVNLTGLTVGSGIIAFAVLIIGIGFAAGSWHAERNGSGLGVDELLELAGQLEEQRESIKIIRQENEDRLDALLIRIARMNARVTRLDALGRRLTGMADIDDGEFDFDADPAIGGPEEPMVLVSNLAEPELLEAMKTLDSQLTNREAQLNVLESVLMNQNLKDRVYPQGRPVGAGWISSYFGKRTDPFTGKAANHTGIDFAGKSGAEIAAVADGVVTWSADRYGYGIMVEINHGSGYATRYAHNSENFVVVGDEVKKGQIVALMGETGRATGPNLHFEVLQNGSRVNPVNFIREVSK